MRPHCRSCSDGSLLLLPVIADVAVRMVVQAGEPRGNAVRPGAGRDEHGQDADRGSRQPWREHGASVGRPRFNASVGLPSFLSWFQLLMQHRLGDAPGISYAPASRTRYALAMDERDRRLRAVDRQSRMTFSRDGSTDVAPISGAAAVALAARLSTQQWLLAGRSLPTHRRSELPIVFRPARTS